MNRTAIIFGVTGQDGSYLSDMLVKKGYFVVGVARRVSTDNTQRLQYFKLLSNPQFKLVEGDITDSISVFNLIQEHSKTPITPPTEFSDRPVVTSGQVIYIKDGVKLNSLGVTPCEIYVLAAQSHVHTSFNQPKLTFDVNTTGLLNVLEAMRLFSPASRLYFAGTSEQFGNSVDVDGFQRETTTMTPCSPYAISKVAAYHLIKNYRESYGLHCNTGILMNHESPMRGNNFVTKKITRYVAGLYHYLNSIDSLGHISEDNYYPKLKMGNIDSVRDWGFAGDYVQAMHLMLQQDKPDDYVIATGKCSSVKDFIQLAFKIAGIQDWKKYVEIDEALLRPSDLTYLKGDSTKAREKLGWKPTMELEDLARIMFEYDLNETRLQRPQVH